MPLKYTDFFILLLDILGWVWLNVKCFLNVKYFQVKILLKNEGSFGNVVLVTLFVIFLKYIWVKNENIIQK